MSDLPPEPTPKEQPEPTPDEPLEDLLDDPLEALSQIGKSTFRRLNGYLHEVTPIVDETGKLLNLAVSPVMVEFSLRDLVQIVIGATILGSPLVLSDEAMNAAATLSQARIVTIAVVSVLFITAFVYFNFYRKMIRGNVRQFVTRVLVTYGLTLVVVAGLLWLFGQGGWGTDPELALRKVIVVGFPASMFATVADALK